MSNYGGAIGTGTATQEVEDFTVHEIEKDAIDDRKGSSSDPSVIAEKGQMINVNPLETTTTNASEQEFLSHEFQFPIDPNAEEEKYQFTLRAVFVGCCLGGVIAASK